MTTTSKDLGARARRRARRQAEERRRFDRFTVPPLDEPRRRWLNGGDLVWFGALLLACLFAVAVVALPFFRG